MPEFITATLPSSPTPAPTHTPLPPTIAPTVAPVPGTTTSEVNVRANTSTASQSLGTIPAFSTIQVIGKDASGKWFQVVFNNGIGWVRADFVQVNNPAQIPVVDVELGSGSGARGVVLRGVNVRSGPGKEFESLGLLNENDVVTILGRESSGTWIKIEYAASPDGTGWVASEYLQIENAAAIPALDDAPPGSVESVTPPASISSAPLDGDSAENPIAIFELSYASAREIQFRGALSEDDRQDWIGFSSQDSRIVIEVLCDSNLIQVELLETGGAQPLISTPCGSSLPAQVKPNVTYLFQLMLTSNGSAAFINYEIRMNMAD